MAVSMSLVLKRDTLTNVDDAAGRWQHEGGTALRGTTVIANYATVRRVTNGGTNAQNTAMLTTTLFFTGTTTPPENITLQGAHDFNSGNEIGSVIAASGAHSQFRTGSFAYTRQPARSRSLRHKRNGLTEETTRPRSRCPAIRPA
jgi:hypothetical protein